MPTSSGSPGTSRPAPWSSMGRVEEGLRLVDEALVAADRGRAVADRHRHRLLQHHRVLSGRVRAAPRPGVDRCADGAGASASPRWLPTTGCAWCIAPRSCSCEAHGRTPCRKRPSPPSASPGRLEPACAREGTLSARGAASPAGRVRRRRSRVPRREPVRLRAAAGSRPAAAGAGQSAKRRRRRSAGRSARRPRPLKRAGLLPAYVEIMLASGDAASGPAPPAASSTRSPSDTRSEALAAMSAQAGCRGPGRGRRAVRP